MLQKYTFDTVDIVFKNVQMIGLQVKSATDSLLYLEHAFLVSYRVIEIYEFLNFNQMLCDSS